MLRATLNIEHRYRVTEVYYTIHSAPFLSPMLRLGRLSRSPRLPGKLPSPPVTQNRFENIHTRFAFPNETVENRNTSLQNARSVN